MKKKINKDVELDEKVVDEFIKPYVGKTITQKDIDDTLKEPTKDKKRRTNKIKNDTIKNKVESENNIKENKYNKNASVNSEILESKDDKELSINNEKYNLENISILEHPIDIISKEDFPKIEDDILDNEDSEKIEEDILDKEDSEKIEEDILNKEDLEKNEDDILNKEEFERNKKAIIDIFMNSIPEEEIKELIEIERKSFQTKDVNKIRIANLTGEEFYIAPKVADKLRYLIKKSVY